MITDIGKYYLYRHVRLDTNKPFYIGIGTKPLNMFTHRLTYNRAFTKDRNEHWKYIIAKTDYRVEILLESDDYNFIQEKEIEFIKLYGMKNKGGLLTNIEYGGKAEKRKSINLFVFNTCGKLLYENISKNQICELLNTNLNILNKAISSKIILNSRYIISNNLFICINEYKLPYRNKQIVELDKNFNFIKLWENSTEIENEYGISKSEISRCASGKLKSLHNKVFIYKYLYEIGDISNWELTCPSKIKVIDTIKNKEYFFKSLKDCCKFFNFNPSSVRISFLKNRLYKKQFIIKYLN
jgi:hypothetical protein